MRLHRAVLPQLTNVPVSVGFFRAQLSHWEKIPIRADWRACCLAIGRGSFSGEASISESELVRILLRLAARTARGENRGVGQKKLEATPEVELDREVNGFFLTDIAELGKVFWKRPGKLERSRAALLVHLLSSLQPLLVAQHCGIRVDLC